MPTTGTGCGSVGLLTSTIRPRLLRSWLSEHVDQGTTTATRAIRAPARRCILLLHSLVLIWLGWRQAATRRHLGCRGLELLLLLGLG